MRQVFWSKEAEALSTRPAKGVTFAGLAFWPALLCSVIVATGCATPPPPETPAKTAAIATAAASQAAPLPQGEVPKIGKPMVKKDGTVVYCRNESITNTRLRNRKVCLTKEEWAMRTDTAIHAFEEVNKQPMPPGERDRL